MKKLGGILLLLIIGLSFLTLAQDSGNEDKAYQCLKDEISNKSSESLSLQEAIFSTLALGSESKLKDKIDGEMSNKDCWPKSSCTIKDTSQAILAYNRINKNTEDAENYLLTKNDSATELMWYLQTDIKDHIQSTCTVSYDERNYDVNIGEDMKISGGAGGCLSLSSSGYWLQVSKSCYGKTFQVSCDQDFITNLLYQKSGSQTIFVSSETHSAPSSGTTEEKVDSQCFKLGNSCDYEGTLWATLALQKTSHEIGSYLPYLLALSTDNRKLFPNTFLYMLTSGDDQYNEIVQSQKQSGFWEAPNSKYNKFYDTSLGMLSLQGTSSSELDLAKSYLQSIQTPEGCWNNNNIRDTAFILYSGWPQVVSGTIGGGGSPEVCEPPTGYCGSQFDCADAQGQVLDNKDCATFGQSCCSVPIVQQGCLEKSGVVCPTGQECSGTEVSSIDGSCCLSSCQPVASQVNECESSGGFCSSSCQSGEEQTSDSCGDFSSVCCVQKQTTQGGIGAWIWILTILIILVTLAIIFRKKLQLLWFKFKNRKSGKSSSGNTRRFPPRGPPRFPLSQVRGRPPIMRTPFTSRRIPARKTASKSDKEMEETLKKLREMSK